MTSKAELKQGGIAIIDYGSQYTQLIARRIREQNVYAEVFAHDAEQDWIDQHAPKAYILSGGPNSAYDADAPKLPNFILKSGKPVLGICGAVAFPVAGALTCRTLCWVDCNGALGVAVHPLGGSARV